jgi:putative oxidoreductase
MPDAGRSLASLLLRLGVGATFFFAGLEKVARGPAYDAAYFGSLGVPLPDVTGPLVSWFELVGGVCLVVGALAAVIAVLFAVEMLFVIGFVRLAEASLAFSVVDAFSALRLEVLLALASTAIALLGPGRWSVEEWLRRRRGGGG